jgi:hypothetical protein
MEELHKEKDKAILSYLTLEQPCNPMYPSGLPLICSKKKIFSDESVRRDI